MTRQNSLKIIVPVFVSFYVMGFVDLVGMATAYVKDDFQLSDSLAQLLPSMVFLWFALIVERMPDYTNELSSLIILSVIGGAVIPPVMGLLSDNVSVTASMFVLMVCMIYVGFASYYSIRTRNK